MSCPVTELYSCFFLNLLFQSTFQTLQLSTEAEINTHNTDLFIIGENTLTVSEVQVDFFNLFFLELN